MKNYLLQLLFKTISFILLFISLEINAQNNPCGTAVAQASVVTIAEDEVLVMPRMESGGLANLSLLANTIGATVIHTYQMGLEHWALPASSMVGGVLLDDVWDFVNYLNNQPNVEFAEPNYILSPSSNDPDLEEQWSLNGNHASSIDALECWNLSPGSSDRIIGLIDSGVDWKHEDLIQNIWQNKEGRTGASYNLGEDVDRDGKVLEWNGTTWVFDPDDVNGIDDDGNGYVDDFIGWDFLDNDNDPRPDNIGNKIDSHGTHVAGIIAAKGDNEVGIAGVHWNAKLMSLKCFNAYGQGCVSNIIKALEYSVDKNVKITNNSYGGPTCTSSLHRAISYCNTNKQLFVTAAGNNFSDNDEVDYFPANYDHPNIVTVMSINKDELISERSNYGLTTVDIGAPGESIYSTLPNNSYGFKTGTSMAAPHVTGALALLWDRMPNLSHLEVKDYIMCNSEGVHSLNRYKCVSAGYLNLGNINGYSVNARISISNLCDDVDQCINIDPVLPSASYTWFFASGAILQGPNPPYHPFYGNSVCVDIVTSCGDFHQVCTELVNEQIDMDFSRLDLGTNMIYPNPVKDFININYNLSEESQVNVSLYNTSGQLIKTLLTDYKMEQKYLSKQFNLGDLQSGIYLLSVTDGENSYCEKIYKE